MKSSRKQQRLILTGCVIMALAALCLVCVIVGALVGLPGVSTPTAIPQRLSTLPPLPSPTYWPREIVLPTYTPHPTWTTYPTNTPFTLATATLPVRSGDTISICSCSSNSYNCSDFASHSEAQSCYDSCLAAGAGDVHQLDSDSDGAACELLP